MGIVLTRQELKELTNRTHRNAQMLQLVHMRIPFTMRGDGTLVVLRDHLEEAITGERPKKVKVVEPNWDAPFPVRPTQGRPPGLTDKEWATRKIEKERAASKVRYERRKARLKAGGAQ